MTLAEQVKAVWGKNQKEIEAKVCAWIKGIEANKDTIEESRNAFHQWEPLRAYTSTTKLKQKGKAVFSLRFHGQEVAEVEIKKGAKPILNVSKTNAVRNLKWFPDLVFSSRVDWNSTEAKNFRSYFKKQNEDKNAKTHSPEHKLEAYLINEMKKDSSAKFGGSFSGIQPVMVDDCPLQIPSPIRFNSQTNGPEYSATGGNIDILARRLVKGKRPRLSVWELKKPHASSAEIEKTIYQSIIYASTLRMMLRSECGNNWYKFFGFTGKTIPDKLEIEAVPTIDINQISTFKKHVAAFKDDQIIGNDRIVLCAAYYDEKLNIKFEGI